MLEGTRRDPETSALGDRESNLVFSEPKRKKPEKPQKKLHPEPPVLRVRPVVPDRYSLKAYYHCPV
jgi:hypothetical protein